MLLGGPLLEYLRYHHYGLAAPEILLVGIVLVSCASLLLLLTSLAPPWARIAAFTSCIFLYIDQQFGLEPYVSFKLLPFLILLGVLLFRSHLEKIVLVTLVTFHATLLPFSSQLRPSVRIVDDAMPDTTLPSIVHIILDEHLGIEGMPAEIDGLAALGEEIKGFYARQGFRLFGKTYSRFVHTSSSIAALLNGSRHASEEAFAILESESHQMRRNNYFQSIGDQGYRIRIYQSTYLDYCGLAPVTVSLCSTYPANSIANLRYLDLPIIARIRLLSIYFLSNESHIYERLRNFYPTTPLDEGKRLQARAPIASPGWKGDRSHAGAAFSQLVQLEHDIAENSGGTLFFAHLLLPHYPYELDRNCNAYGSPSQRLDRVAYPQPYGNSPTTRRVRYLYYGGQMRCLYRRLAEFMEGIASASGSDNMVIMIHGDHGSRIAIRDPRPWIAAELTEDDLRDSFSTIFAIKGPEITPGYDTSLVALDRIFRAVLESGFRSTTIPEPQRHSVMLEGPRGVFYEHRMSSF